MKEVLFYVNKKLKIVSSWSNSYIANFTKAVFAGLIDVFFRGYYSSLANHENVVAAKNAKILLLIRDHELMVPDLEIPLEFLNYALRQLVT
jgi:hypothetical protein